MLKGMFHEFLESSTIHGLSHISQGESRLSRFLWLVIVASCFGTAIYMITNSYNEWQTSPVSTTITTHPISYLKFPTVTVCPPKGRNTALNHVLRNVKNDSLIDIDKPKLKDIARKVFVEIPNKKHANRMKELLSKENMKSILDEEMSFPQIDENNKVTLKFQEGQGRFKTPGFGDPKYKGEFYSKNHSFHLVLEVQSDFLRKNEIVISVRTEGNWSYRFSASGYQVYDHQLSMSEAEKFCISQSGHLPSVTSEAENDEIGKVAKRGFVWLGARRLGQSGKMLWLDKRPWDYEDWAEYPPKLSKPEPTNTIGEDCVRFCKGFKSCSTKVTRGTWYDDPCDLELRPVCLIPSTVPSVKRLTAASGNKTLLMRKHPDSTRASLQFWWIHDPNIEGSKRSSPGFQITWQAKNRRNTENQKYELEHQGFQNQTFQKLSTNKEMRNRESSNRTSEERSMKSQTMNMKRRQKRDNFRSKRKPKNAKWGMVNLAQTSRLQKKTDLLRTEVLKRRWSFEVLKEEPCFDERRAELVINQIQEELHLEYKEYPQISDEDIELGVELYSYLHYCEKKVVEAAKLSVLFEELLTNHSLRTVVASTMNNMQPRVGHMLKDLTAMNLWFEHLDKTLNFSLGPLLVSLSSKRELESLLELDLPFLRNYAELIERCITKEHCDGAAQITGKQLQQSSHPVHLTGEGHLEVSSSFILFCAYKSNLVLSKNPLWLSNISFPLCSSFQPTRLEGQLCYKIELNGRADEGKVNELTMLLDYNEDRSLTPPCKNETRSYTSNITELNLDPAGNYQQQKAKIKIDTLSNYVGYGGGSYKMMTVKKMSATPAFLGMTDEERHCDIERFQDCRTRTTLEACQCVPGHLKEYFDANMQNSGHLAILNICDPKGRECIESKSQEKFNCSVSCEGIHADVQYKENEVNLKLPDETEENHDMSSVAQNGKGVNFEHLLRMVDEYTRYKKSKVTSFGFNPTAFQSQFVQEAPESTIELVQIYFDTATFDNIQRDKKIKLDAQISLIGGTMGLLTGFSIVSGVEIVAFLVKLIMSLRVKKATKDKFGNHK